MNKNKSSNSPGNHQSSGVVAFFILTYVLTMLTWGVLVIFRMPVASSTSTDASTSTLAMVLYLVGGFTPTIAGIIMTYRLQGRAGLREMWQRFKQFKLGAMWYLLIVIVPLLVQAGTAIIYKMLGGGFVRPDYLEQPVLLIPFIIPIFIFGPLSEEFGWRGFAQDRVQARWGNLKGNLILGLVWGFWHTPLFFVQNSGQQQTGNPALMLPVFVIQVIAMTILISWVYNNTNRSLWGAVFFHFTINFATNLLITSSEATAGFVYITNAGLMVLLATIVIIITRGQLKEIQLSRPETKRISSASSSPR